MTLDQNINKCIEARGLLMEARLILPRDSDEEKAVHAAILAIELAWSAAEARVASSSERGSDG